MRFQFDLDALVLAPRAVLATAAVCATTSLGATQGFMQDLGATATHHTHVAAFGVDASGGVVVGTSNGTVFRWTPSGGMVAITHSTSSSMGWRPCAISADGSVIVGQQSTGQPCDYIHGFHWSTATGLQTLTWPFSDVVPQGVSGDGTVVVGSLRKSYPCITADDPKAFRWSSTTGIQILPSPTAYSWQAMDVSDDGLVIVGFENFEDGLVWTPAGVRQIDAQALGLVRAELHSVSGDGRVALGMARSPALNGQLVAVQWDLTTDTPSFLPFLGTTASWAGAVNYDGSVVVGQYSPGGGAPRLAFHLSAISGLTLLGTLGGSNSGAGGVSADGSVAVGSSDLSTMYQVAAFRWDFGSIGAPYCDAIANSTGLVGHINATGDRDVTANSVVLSADRLPANAFSFFLVSPMPGNIYPVMGSIGRLCLGGGIGRYVGPGQIQNSGPAGAIQIQLDLTTLPTPSGSVTVNPGETWSFQAWHRDSNPGPMSNFTDAISVTFI